MQGLDVFLLRLRTAPAVLVTVVATRGSVPRDVGAWMAVFSDTVCSTIGGGRLEHDAIAQARQMLHSPPVSQAAQSHERNFVLGPSLGQCCGGEMRLHFESASAADAVQLALRLEPQRTSVALFGGGHVGLALARVLCLLPVRLQWVDSRDEVFPPGLPAQVVTEHSDPVEAAVASLAAGSRVVIMSFSHAEDFSVVAACLQRQRLWGDLPYVGLIGSTTKWASFRQRLQARGFSSAELAHIHCPIGVAGVHDKRPEVIAVAIAAQLMQVQMNPHNVDATNVDAIPAATAIGGVHCNTTP
jgi:xanthine dehydrogenase accessory factor